MAAGGFSEFDGSFDILSGQWSGKNSTDGLVGVGEVCELNISIVTRSLTLVMVVKVSLQHRLLGVPGALH